MDLLGGSSSEHLPVRCVHTLTVFTGDLTLLISWEYVGRRSGAMWMREDFVASGKGLNCGPRYFFLWLGCEHAGEI